MAKPEWIAEPWAQEHLKDLEQLLGDAVGETNALRILVEEHGHNASQIDTLEGQLHSLLMRVADKWRGDS